MRGIRQSAPSLVLGGGRMGFPPGLGGLGSPPPETSPQRQELTDIDEPPRTATGEMSRRRHPE